MFYFFGNEEIDARGLLPDERTFVFQYKLERGIKCCQWFCRMASHWRHSNREV